jgi:hypothetical protein
VYATGDVFSFSDSRAKREIYPISGAMDKVGMLNGYTYTKVDSGRRETGVLAEEIEAVLPEAVSTASSGYKSVAYGNMVGLLIEALKDVHGSIGAMSGSIGAMSGSIAQIADRVAALETKV